MMCQIWQQKKQQQLNFIHDTSVCCERAEKNVIPEQRADHENTKKKPSNFVIVNRK